MKKLFLFLLVLSLTSIALAGCESLNALSLNRIKTETSSTVLDYAGPAAINLLTSIQSGDFQAFMKDFNGSLKSFYSQNDFQNLKDRIATRLGAYRNIELKQVSAKENLIAAIYLCQYQKGSIILELDMEPAPPYLLAGVSFPNLP